MRNAGNILAAARRYLRITQLARCGPHKRIRARAFFANGVKEFCVAGVVQALPVMIHLTSFTFLAGLLVYLQHQITPGSNWLFAGWALLSMVHSFITFMPIFPHDRPYCSPLSPTAWYLHAIIPYSILKVPEMRPRYRLRLSIRERRKKVLNFKSFDRCPTVVYVYTNRVSAVLVCNTPLRAKCGERAPLRSNTTCPHDLHLYYVCRTYGFFWSRGLFFLVPVSLRPAWVLQSADLLLLRATPCP